MPMARMRWMKAAHTRRRGRGSSSVEARPNRRRRSAHGQATPHWDGLSQPATEGTIVRQFRRRSNSSSNRQRSFMACGDRDEAASAATASARKGKEIDPALIGRGPGLLTVHGDEHKNPTFLLAERLLMRWGSRNREAHTEPDHNQRV
jgi:hypothetical protein